MDQMWRQTEQKISYYKNVDSYLRRNKNIDGNLIRL